MHNIVLLCLWAAHVCCVHSAFLWLSHVQDCAVCGVLFHGHES